MNKQKIAIVGKGTAGSQAAIYFSRFFPDAEIDWYFDPNRPAQSVGEGSTLTLPRNLFMSMGFSHTDLKKVNGSFKTGIYKKNWAKKNHEFFHDFPPPQVGYHFSATELQEYIESNIQKISKNVKIISKEVDFNNVDSTVVFNASGRPDDFSDFHQSEYIPVNSAHVNQCSWNGAEFDYTLTIAAKHGWIFGIPLQNRLSIGYMYNNGISSVEDLQEELEEIFAKYGVRPSGQANNLTFNNYYRKNNYQDGGRIVHSGNASFFLEPLEATSITVMNHIQSSAFDIWRGKKSAALANSEYLRLLHEIEFMIMMHYASGSGFKSDFWEFAKERGVKKIKDSYKDQEIKKMYSMVRGIKNYGLATDLEYFEYGSWWPGSFIQNIQGLFLEDIFEEFVT